MTGTRYSTHRSSYVLRGQADTRVWGTALGSRLRAGDIVALVGDLGSGKTTLTQFIAIGMGILASVTSPTFSLAQEYDGSPPLYHFDPYRLESPDAFADIGFEDYLLRGGVVVIEWADRVEEYLPAERLTIAITSPNGESTADVRRLEVTAVGDRHGALLAAINGRHEVADLREERP